MLFVVLENYFCNLELLPKKRLPKNSKEIYHYVLNEPGLEILLLTVSGMNSTNWAICNVPNLFVPLYVFQSSNKKYNNFFKSIFFKELAVVPLAFFLKNDRKFLIWFFTVFDWNCLCETKKGLNRCLLLNI